MRANCYRNSRPAIKSLACFQDRIYLDGLSENDILVISRSLKLMFKHALMVFGRNNAMGDWVIEGMEADSYKTSDERILLKGNLSWSVGGDSCSRYEASINLKNTPPSYRFNIFDRESNPKFTITNSFDGWSLITPSGT